LIGKISKIKENGGESTNVNRHGCEEEILNGIAKDERVKMTD